MISQLAQEPVLTYNFGAINHSGGPVVTKGKIWIISIAALTVVLAAACIAYAFLVNEYKKSKFDRYSTRKAVTESRQLPPGTQFILFGDSRAERWPQSLQPFPGDTFNAGIGGDVTPNMLWRLPQDVLAVKPKVVVMLAGINDIVTASLLDDDKSRTLRVDSAITHLTKMIHLMESANIKVIVFTVTPPLKPDIMRSLIWGSSIPKDVERVNTALRKLASDNVIIIDDIAAFKTLGDHWEQAARVDALHFSKQGYGALKTAVENVASGN